MASSSGSPFHQMLQWVDTVDEVKETVKELKHQKEIAVDCKGKNLSRVGTLDILTIGTVDENIFLFDIKKLGATAFNGTGLREMLESGSAVKLMYDCRNDSDALMKRLYNVKLNGVLDLQLVEFYRTRRNATQPENWKSLRDCLEEYTHDDVSVALKDRISEQIRDAHQSGKTIWNKRPLSSELKDYCAVDTVKLFTLKKELFRIEEMFRNEMLEASRERILATRSSPSSR